MPDGTRLETLSNARAYILELSEVEQASTKWQTAAGELPNAADPPCNGPWIDFARLGMNGGRFTRRRSPHGHRRHAASAPRLTGSVDDKTRQLAGEGIPSGHLGA